MICHVAWERRRYRGHKVWILVDEAGEFVLDERGHAQLRYKPEDERTYTVRPAEIRALEEDGVPAVGPSAIQVWACAEGPDERGAAGVGVLLRWRDRTREIKRRIRAAAGDDVLVRTTLAALGAIRRPDLPVRLRIAGAERLEALLSGATASPPAAGEALLQWARRFPDLVILSPPDRDEHAERARRLARGAPEA